MLRAVELCRELVEAQKALWAAQAAQKRAEIGQEMVEPGDVMEALSGASWHKCPVCDKEVLTHGPVLICACGYRNCRPLTVSLWSQKIAKEMEESLWFSVYGGFCATKKGRRGEDGPGGAGQRP